MTPHRLHLDHADAIGEVETQAAHHPWSVAQLHATLVQPTTVGWGLSSADGRLVGHLLTRQVVDEAEVLTIAVAPDHRRRGHARALLTAAEMHWRQTGVLTAWLDVRTDNHAARALYARHGWVDVGVRARYYPDGTDAAQMRWEAV